MERVLLNSNTRKGNLIRRIISYMLVIVILATSVSLDAFTKKAEASGGYVTLYLKDDTAQHWLGNDNAVMELVDNTYGHDHYIMTKVNSTTWSCKVPASTYNVTFNRLSPDKSTQWNSWSAGGRDGHSTYHATVPEHGYWDGTAVVDNDYFHEGDIVYLDFYSFTDTNGNYLWELSNAIFYINFTSYSKSDNNGQDITISSADSTKFSPILLTDEIETQVFKYVVTAEDEGATALRFFRGNSATLWNNSVVLNYSDYKAGNNCVKVQGWDNTGYVCPYVPRRHITQIDSAAVSVTGNRKVNRKIELDFNLTGETEYLSQEDTVINIIKIDSNGNEIQAGEGEVFFILDETAAQWNHRELIFKQAGSYKISAAATDGYDDFSAETAISVVEDAAPQALFDISCGEGESTDSKAVYVRNSEGTAHISVTDASVSELGDTISERTYVLYHDANNDGEFDNDEIIDTKQGNLMEVSYELNTVGKYRVVLNIKETFTDTIPSLVDDSVYLRGSCARDFEITNQAPVSAMSMEKSKLSDIIFTVGNADSELLAKYAEVTAGVEEKLVGLGIEANVSTVSTSALTAKDTFAWREYGHENFADPYFPNIEHIIYDGNDIKMVGYSVQPLKDFLYVADSDSSRKVFDFDLQRDNNNWHSMEGGGFLFNTIIDDDENYIQGYCILVTQYGLKLVQIDRTNLANFRNGSYQNVQNAGRLLQTYGMTNLLDNHHFKIIVDKNVLTVYDDDRLLINQYVLPDDGVDAYGYGPIISHVSHWCRQQSYFTFKNIVMQTITGESLSDVVNNHEWTPGTNHYVINLSETSVPELSDTDRMADVAAALISKDAMFFGIGNENTTNQYNSLVNAIDGNGENISLTYAEDNGEDSENEEDNEDNESDEITVETAVDQIVARIIADIESKDYSIGYTITTDEKVTYKDTYSDPEGDATGEEIWEYLYDASVFGEEETEPETIQRSEPITMFTNAGAYTVTHRVSDNPTQENAALDTYIRWADTDEYQKLILAQNRPAASVTVTTTQKPSDADTCMVNVIYESEDPDHPSDVKKGIREEKFYYKEMGETEWTEGRFPTEVTMGTTYLVKYEVKDIEGTWSRPAVQAVRTSEAREYVRPDDNTPPQCSITVSKETVEAGETLYIEAVVADDYGVTGISLKVNGTEIAMQPGRYAYVPEEAGTLEITLTATDICGNEGTAEKTVRVTDKSDTTPPAIIITSPKNGTVTGNVDIIGSITDDRALASYRVVQSRVITGNQEEPEEEQTQEGQTDGQEETVLAQGTEEIIDGTIATVETDTLEAGVYKIEITAADKAGLSSSVYMLLTVEHTGAGDRIPPTAVISDIALDNENSLVEITGTVNDETELKNYTLKVYKKNSAGSDSEEILSVTGNEAKSEEVLGTVSTQGLASGDYSVILTAEDSAGNQTTAKAGFTYTAGTTGDDISRNSDTEPPVIIAELNAEIKGESLNIDLRGTIADASSLVYTVTLGKKQTDGTLSGALIIAAGEEGINDDEIASYSLKPYETGDYAVIIEAEDAYGNARKIEYTITVTPNGTVNEGYGGETGGKDDEPGTGKLNLVLGKTTASVNESVTAYLAYPDTAENVKLVLKNRKTGQETETAIHGRTAEVTAASYGEYEVILSADIGGERQSVSADLWFLDADDDTYPVAEFITPESESIIKTMTDITGTVSDDKELKYYTLEYKQEGTDDYIELSRGTEPVTDGKLGTLDTTKLLNGRYVLRLTAVDMAGHRIRTERYIYVEGNLKVGNMSIGFTDITSNVAGIPLSLTRNYDSRNKTSGDFGTGWSMGLMDIRLKEASDICTGYSMTQVGQMLSTGYYITQTSCHDVVITYGDGTSDRFELTLSPERQALIPIYQVTVSFRCVTNPKLKLSINGGSQAMLYGTNLMFDDLDMLEYHSYILTREDGTKLYLDEQHGLLSMEDANGNKVTVTNAGFKHTDGNGITFTRDAENRIIKAEETDSQSNVINKVEYAYDSNDNLISVTDNAGRTVGYTYDDDHNLIDIIDPSGAAIARNVYDEDGRLVATIDSDGNRIEYEHDIDGRTEIVRDKLGNATVYTYDDNGNVLQVVDALGNKTENTYDSNNHLLTKKDANGNITTYLYDSTGNLTSLTNADGVTEELGYNELNIVGSIKMADNVLMTMDYDSKGNLTKMTDALGNDTELAYASDGKLTGVTDEIGTVHKLVYDSDGNLISMEDGNGNKTKYSYSADGRCTGVTIKRTEADGSVQEYTSTYSYDTAGNIISAVSNTGVVTAYEYDFRNNMTAAVDAKNRRTDYAYDSQDNLTKVTYPDGTSEEFTYDANGNNITAKSRTGITVTMTYDKLNRLVKKTYADGAAEAYTYDANGNVLTYTGANGGTTTYTYDCMNRNTSITDAYGNITVFEYDSRSQLVKEEDALGNVFEFTYDANGNQIGIKYPDGQTESAAYDARNRQVSSTDRNGNTTLYAYDNADNLISVMDAAGGIYTYTFNETYSLTKVCDAKGNETKYEYDGEGRLVKIINAAGQTAEYTYDIMGNVKSCRDYSGKETSYQYDDNDRLIKVSDNDGDTVYAYDTLGRLVGVTDSNGSISYTYDEYSRLSSKTTYDLGKISYTYDIADRVSSITTSINNAVDGTGNATDTAVTAYNYDLMDRVVRVVGHDGSATLYEYDAIGNRTAVKHEGGLTVNYRYDSCSRLVNETVTDKDSNVFIYYDYSYGNAGEKTKAVEIARSSKDDTDVRVIRNTYTYDNLLRLTGEKIEAAENVPFADVLVINSSNGNNNGNNNSNGGSDEQELTAELSEVVWEGSIENQYTFDAVSNRTKKVTVIATAVSGGDVCGLAENAEAGTTNYTYNSLNQLTAAITGDTTVTYTYDLNGNLVAEHGGSEDKTYTYDADNRLVTATVSSGNNVTIESYAYDYEGNRISKQTNEDGRIYYLNDDAYAYTQVSLELRKAQNGSYVIHKYYTRGTELLSADILEDNSYVKKLYIMDGHGSVTALAENVQETGTGGNSGTTEESYSQELTDTYVYDAYGNLLKQTGDTDNDYLYTGEQYNETTGLYYLRARYLSPETGTFVSMDSYAGTLDNPVSLHKYLYANANPVMYVDPSGNFSLMETSIAQGIQATISDLIAPGLTMKKVMTWANLIVTGYDVYQQAKLIFAGEANIMGLAKAVFRGIKMHVLLNCLLPPQIGKTLGMIFKVTGVIGDAQSLGDALKSGDPEKIFIESLRFAVSVYSLKCQCFTEDTLVSTVDGDRPIGELEVGDKVWAYNTETGENEAKEITAVIVTETDVIVHVKTSDGEDINTTMFHPFYVRHFDKESDGSVYDGEWKAASNLLAGDVLQKIDGSTVYVTEVTVEKLPEIINVYNLEIEDLHTYYVADGVLVHNECDEDVDVNNSKKVVNNKGIEYPEVKDIRTGENMIFPEDVGARIPKEQRVGWYRNQREANMYRTNDADILCKKDYIDEWYRRGYETPEGGWENYEIHHIKPREFGGNASFENLIPLPIKVHRGIVTPWWNNYGDK